jgi:hypothetical protein
MCKACVESSWQVGQTNFTQARPYEYFDWCDCCDGLWCSDCTPGPYRCLGANFGMKKNNCCQSSHCPLCKHFGHSCCA